MKRLEKMTLQELWQLFPIILEAPNPNWKDWAADEISSLKEQLGAFMANISHIGSTATDGIWAKPIIDIIAETDSRENFETIKNKIIESGYICMNESEFRIDFNKGYSPSGFTDKVYHLHLRLSGDNDEILFRDYLNAHPLVAKEYEKLKLSLWKQFEHDRDGYTQAKTSFISHYTALAKAQNQNHH